MTTLRLIEPDGPAAVPAARGRLMTAEQVVSELFGGSVTVSWEKRNAPHKLRLGHSTVRWFEADLAAWLEQRRAG